MGLTGIVRGLVTVVLVLGLFLVGGNKVTDKLDPGMHAKLMYPFTFRN
jgi:hypothetical protein